MDMDMDMENTSVTVRRMKRNDLDLLVTWAAAEGWNPGLHDVDCFFTADHFPNWSAMICYSFRRIAVYF